MDKCAAFYNDAFNRLSNDAKMAYNYFKQLHKWTTSSNMKCCTITEHLAIYKNDALFMNWATFIFGSTFSAAILP